LRTVFLSLTAAATLVAQVVGMAPRPGPADYSAQAPSKAAVLAAALLPPDQIKRILGADVDRAGYLVFEVAIYPEEGRQPLMTAADFALQAGSNPALIRMSEPAVVAAAVFPFEKPQPPPGKAQPAAKAGGRGGEAPAATARDRARSDLQFALSAKLLPSGKLTSAVAGYLYFRKPAAAAKTYDLLWFGPDAPTRMTIKTPPAPRPTSK
jgi:hypothetical protein